MARPDEFPSGAELVRVNPTGVEFGLDDEALLLKSAARRFLQERCPIDVLHRRVAASSDPTRARESIWDAALWPELVELGWPAVAVPESAGGYGMGLSATVGLAEELGRAAFPSPMIATLCSTFVLAACGSDAADELLRAIAEGTKVSLALTNRRGSWNAADTDVEARGGDSLILDGTAWFVQDAQKADVLLVKVRSPAGVQLCIVDVDAPGVNIVPDAILDLTRDQAHVELRGVEVRPDRIAAPPELGVSVLNAAEPAMLAIVAADMVGAAEWQLQTTAEYARTRIQFDRPIGFFQAVKHQLVDMMLMLDEARSLVYEAAATFDHEPARAELTARMAKSAASDMAAYCSSRSVQLHGGIGFTWECFVHLYFKRQKHNEVLLGDGPWQRAKLANQLIGPIGTFA